ncbi:hypothetical protein BV20DRAFT_984638 [Pilatotrama ljubarskyi]|nr:hypothetical protein BV20DRAFT_984638 [Pilatotrama ljubarskyi]
MLRNARSSLTAVARRLEPASSTLRFASTTPTEKASSSSEPLPPPARTRDASSSRNTLPRKQFRSKHFKVSENAGQQRPKRLLKPYEVSGRIIKMCSEGKLEEAYEYLQNLPLDAQNTAVWNTLIQQAGEAKRFRMGYLIYIEMKRRGFKANSSTYATLMSMFLKVDSWRDRGKLLLCVHKVYDSYMEYMAAVKEHNPQSPELSTVPINAYIQVIGKAGQHQRAFDVYNALDEEGPLAPDRITYTNMFRGIYLRGSVAGEDEQSQKLRERAASDARLIWRHVQKRVEAGANLVDGVLISRVVQALAIGRPADHIVAFDIIRDYVGLARPGETAPPPRVALSSPLLQDILWLCNKAQKYRLCTHFVQQVMEKNPEILDRGHFDHVMTAYGSLSALGSPTEPARALQMLEWMLERELTSKDGFRIRPGLPTFTLVLVVCWRAKDWESALRTFEIMSGYRAADFADGATRTPQMTPRSQGRNIMPDAAALSCLVRTALESGDEAAMRQCARIVRHLGVGQVFVAKDAGPESRGERTGVRFEKDQAFYAHKAARALVELVDVLVPKRTEGSAPLTAEQREWTELRSEARSFLIAQREHRPKGTPQMEEQPLGSAAGLAAMDNDVEWQRIHREQKSAR